MLRDILHFVSCTTEPITRLRNTKLEIKQSWHAIMNPSLSVFNPLDSMKEKVSSLDKPWCSPDVCRIHRAMICLYNIGLDFVNVQHSHRVICLLIYVKTSSWSARCFVLNSPHFFPYVIRYEEVEGVRTSQTSTCLIQNNPAMLTLETQKTSTCTIR